MLIINLMIIMLFLYSIILLSGKTIIFKHIYTQVLLFLFIIYTPLSKLIEGYKLKYTGISSIIIFSIVFLLIFIWGYKRNKYMYSIHNVKQEDIINIIEEYLKIKNKKYEIKENEIYFPELYKTIFLNGLIEISLDCRDIKDMYFYNELIDKIKIGIKEINQRKIPIEGIVYLFFVGILYLIKTYFLKI